MPRVAILRRELNAIDLPPICLVTGATEGVRFHEVKFRKSSSAWFVLSLLLICVPVAGILLMLTALVALAVLTPKVRGELPYSEAGRIRAARGELLRTLAYSLVGLSAVALPFAVVGAINEHLTIPLYAAIVGFALGVVAIPILALTVGRSRVWPVSLDAKALHLNIPSDAAAAALRSRLYTWKPDLDAPWSTRAATDARDCPQHMATPARWICGRCGSFACDTCMGRVRADSMLLCRACLARRPS